MRINKSGFFTVMVLALVVAATAVAGAASQQFAAKVNGVGIKTLTLDAAVNNFIENQKMFGVTVKEEEKGKLRTEILDQLVAAELLYQQSQKAGLGDLAKQISDEYENIKKGFGSEAEFKKILKEKSIKEADLKEDVKKGIYINTFLETKVFPNLNVTEEAKKQEYETNKDKLNVPESVRASHILIKAAADANEEVKKAAKDKIEALRQRLAAGEDFAALAKENSEDGTASNGGDLGYFKRGDMVKSFEDVAFTMEKDQISAVIETQFGYHVLKVMDKKPARTLTYEEVSEDIGKFLLNKLKRDEVNKVVESLKKTAKIEML
ncbi:MAG: peptidylprolyl isomerase [Candidatus Omnitrophota bacterium]